MEALQLQKRKLDAAPRDVTPLTDSQVARAMSRYARMTVRGGVQLSFVPLGPRVRADDSDELRAATLAAIVSATLIPDAMDA